MPQISTPASWMHPWTICCVTNRWAQDWLDVRLMNPMLPDDPNSKLNVCVQNVLKIWGGKQDQKLTQLLFCDLSTPKNDGNFNVYEDIRKKLVAAGVPENGDQVHPQRRHRTKKGGCVPKCARAIGEFCSGRTKKGGGATISPSGGASLGCWLEATDTTPHDSGPIPQRG